MTIKHDAHPKGKVKQVVHFRDLLKCVDDETDNQTDAECKWKHVFVLFTTLRPFRLYAYTQAEKQKWIYYIQSVIT